MLVLKDRHHVVKMSVVGLANIARVSVEQCRQALMGFEQPDLDSTDKQYEGRRIEALPDGGWRILNGERYAKMLSYTERREYNRMKQAEYRKRRKEIKNEADKEGGRDAIHDGLEDSRKIDGTYSHTFS